jgi:hypothetical protein
VKPFLRASRCAVGSQGKTAVKNSSAQWGGGGHNNIENNPVFRGMVRQNDGLLTKGKL